MEPLNPVTRFFSRPMMPLISLFIVSVLMTLLLAQFLPTDADQMIYSSVVRPPGERPRQDVFIKDMHFNLPYNLTRDVHGQNYSASWSPDGEAIIFFSRPHQQSQVYLMVMDPNGENARILADNARSYTDGPFWSPDHQHAVFLSSRPFSNNRADSYLTIVHRDGTEADIFKVDRWIGDPVWTRDSQAVRFMTWSDRTIVEARVGTSEVQMLSNWQTDLEGRIPTFSPYGERSLMVTERAAQSRNNDDVYVMHLETGEIQNLTPNFEHDIDEAVWSPDGEQIAFLSEVNDAENQFWLFVINADGTQRRRIAQLSGNIVALTEWVEDDLLLLRITEFGERPRFVTVSVEDGEISANNFSLIDPSLRPRIEA